MKYILSEDCKRLLDERFVLAEDLEFGTFAEKCKELLEYIKKLLKNAGVDSDSDADKEAKKIKVRKAAESAVGKTLELIRALDNVKDVNIARGRFEEYKKAVDSMLTTIDPDYKRKGELFGIFNAISSDLGEGVDFKIAKKQLLKDLHRISPAISEISAGLSAIEDAETHEKFSSSRQEEILRNAYSDVYKLSQIPSDKYDLEIKSVFSGTIELLANKMDVAKADDSKIADFLRVCELASNDKDGALRKGINANKGLFAGISASDVASSLKDGQDWGKRYAAAADKAIVWQEYLKAVWKENADLVDSLGEPFRQECEKLGFNGASNPFIAFLENYLVKKHYPIDRAHYFAIHNAVASGSLKKTDLTRPTDPVTDDNNILFWEDFYLKGSPADYLEYFGTLRGDGFSFEGIKKTVADLDAPEANKTLFTAIGKWTLEATRTKADFIYLIMSDANPLDKLLNGNDDKTPYAIKAPTQRLRPVAEIAQLLNAFNVEVERKKAFSTSNIDTLVTTLSGPEYSSGIKSLAPKIIRRLADAAGSDAASVREYDALGMKYPKIKSDAAAYSWEEGQKILKLVSEIGGDIDWGTLNKIAKKFEEKGWFGDGE